MIYADEYKFVVIVNKELDGETGRAINATSHCVAGLVNSASDELREKMSFIDFKDKNDVNHKSISALSLIVLKGKNGELRKAREKFKELNIHYTDFIETMTGDTYREQLEKTALVTEEETKYFCIAAFGRKDEIDLVTKKFSLYR